MFIDDVHYGVGVGLPTNTKKIEPPQILMIAQ